MKKTLFAIFLFSLSTHVFASKYGQCLEECRDSYPNHKPYKSLFSQMEKEQFDACDRGCSRAHWIGKKKAIKDNFCREEYGAMSYTFYACDSAIRGF